MNNRQICTELTAMYQTDAYSYASVKYWAQQIKLGRNDLFSTHSAGRPALDHIDAMIFDAITKEPFHSVRSLAERVGFPTTTVYRHLTDNLGFHSYISKWIPHMLTNDLREKRITEADALFNVLKAQERIHFRDVITGDESWFYIQQKRPRMWVLTADNLPEIPKTTIATQKVMLTVFFGINGVVLTNWMIPPNSLNASYFLNEILVPLSHSIHGVHPKQHSPFTIIHFDNAKPHTAKMTMNSLQQLHLKRAPHPPFSPEIAPSDFYLFGAIKEQLKTYEFESIDAMKFTAEEKLREIPLDTFERVFNEWMERLEIVKSNNGDYI
jgi:hypothetical protein